MWVFFHLFLIFFYKLPIHKDRNNVTVDLNQQKVVGVKSIGKDAAQRSNGLFKENDWECPKCSNINWAKRNYCNQCNAPRFRSAEARTGLGGGFKENDDVDYIVRGNDNEEFDEYGRRRGKINPTDHSIVVEASANSDDDDDDDDETNNADNKVDIDSDTDNITSESRSNSSVSESETSSINESEGDDDDDDDANLSKYNFDSDSSENGDTTDNSDECSEDNSKHSKLKRYAPSSPSNDSDGNLSNTHHKKSKLD